MTDRCYTSTTLDYKFFRCSLPEGHNGFIHVAIGLTDEGHEFVFSWYVAPKEERFLVSNTVEVEEPLPF